MTEHAFAQYSIPRHSETEILRRGRDFMSLMAQRRSVRHFSAEPVSRELIEIAIETASSAPSGAHRQPWRFLAVSEPDVKHRIRMAAEAEEPQSY